MSFQETVIAVALGTLFAPLLRDILRSAFSDFVEPWDRFIAWLVRS